MKLSQLKAYIKRIEEHAQGTDPEISFWLSNEVESAVTAIQRTAFIDTEIDTEAGPQEHKIYSEKLNAYSLRLKVFNFPE